MRVLIEGETKSGKTKILKEKYKELLDSSEETKKILVLVANRLEVLNFRKDLALEPKEEYRVYSYFGFVQEEIKKNWSLILEKSKKIKKDIIEPTFMTFEASQCLMGKTVEFYRKKGYINNLNISNEEISKKLLSNILEAALNNLVYTKIGEKLKKYGELKEEKLYDEMNEIIDKYMEKTLESGTFDYGTSIYLYNQFLLRDASYLEELVSSINYLILDSMEIASTAEIDFVEKVKGEIKGIIMAKNTDGPYGIFSYNIGYLEKKILDTSFEKIILKPFCLSTNDFLKKFEDNLYSNKVVKGLKNIELSIEDEYKSDNNRMVIKKVLELLDAGVEPEDISVITPQNDIVLEFAFQKISKERKFKFMNISRNEIILDNPYTYALIISSILFYNFEEITLNFDELKIFFIYFLEIDPIRGGLLANYIGARTPNKYKLIEIKSKEIETRISKLILKKYDRIRETFEKTPKDIQLHDFFNIIYNNILINGNGNGKDIKRCRELIESSRKFVKTLGNFSNIKDINYEFIKFLRGGAKAAESLIELDERLNGKFFSISTPYGYINSGRRSKYQIWTDIRNKNFIPDTKNILQNSWVLSKTWKGERFSFEDEYEIEKINTMGILKRLIKSCNGEIFIYGSKYSSGSHYQNGLLYKGLKKIEF